MTTYYIPMKLPSLNEYINACRSNRYAGANMKKETEAKISQYINQMPKYETPIKLHFVWQEKNKRRDYDNIAFAKKFILDAMQKYGKLENDNRKNVVGFTDEFTTGDSWAVFVTVEEITE